MLTGFRYRLSLTDERAEQCTTYGAIRRAVWNTALDQRRRTLERWRRGHAVPFCGHRLQAARLAEAPRPRRPG
ncbi:helix-turn-helix domain-containing protein [Nocardiopsis sp. N85]|uniref:helix-turn-helix domain-containing protein n=1 Tax=Nocardiopsis sp. N85 TaxID=3029400 RepID=UPI00237F726C|nr:helix-turn-helix domain-containing protein [Nocardiopsis sp. N85]MDE3721539.1 helix-turn-helix domain-containing protein [Nocardiopsis sp. N85]